MVFSNIVPPSFGTVSAHDELLRKHLLAYPGKLMNTKPTHLATSSHARAHAVALFTLWPPSMSLPTQSPERCRYPDKAESGGWPERKQISQDSYPSKIVGTWQWTRKRKLIIPNVHCTFINTNSTGRLKCYYRPTASLQLNNKGNTKYNITVT